MRGITNAPQGGGSGGGDWNFHYSNDWTDLFEVSGANMTSKCDIWIYYNNTPFCGELFIPKGTTQTVIRIPVTGSRYNNNLLFIGGVIDFRSQHISSSTANLVLILSTYAFAVSGSDVTVTDSTSTQNISKTSGFVIMYR